MYTSVARNVHMTIQVEQNVHIATTILVRNTNLKKSSTMITSTTSTKITNNMITNTMVTSITTIRNIEIVNLSMKK